MTTGSAILLVLEVLSLGTCLFFLRGVLGDWRARRTLARSTGTVEDVEFSRSGQSSGSRAVIRFEDAHGQVRRFKTEWSEAPYAVGQVVTVGHGGSSPPRVLSWSVFFQKALVAAIPGVVAIAVLVALTRTWFSR